MKIHYLQHADFETLGAIETWANANQHEISRTQTYAGANLPNTFDFDLLIVLGGPQSSLTLDKFPYLKDEITLIKQAIDAGKCVIGICLGAQLIAKALGAQTQASPCREIGSYPITLTSDGEKDALVNLSGHCFNVFHWHNDMPGLAIDAKCLAMSDGCPVQAFVWGDRVYGFQFHLEFTPESIQALIENCSDDLYDEQYVMSEAQLRALMSDDYQQMNQRLFHFLDGIAKLAGEKITLNCTSKTI